MKKIAVTTWVTDDYVDYIGLDELKNSFNHFHSDVDFFVFDTKATNEAMVKDPWLNNVWMMPPSCLPFVDDYDMVYLNMEKAMDSKSSKHNLVLVEGDSIIVPKTMDVVHISGSLMNLEGNSISAPHFKRRRANYYINNFAGGFTKENKKSNTVVVYPNGIAKKTINFGLFSISPKIKKGSTIIVANKIEKKKEENENPVDWNKQIENAMLKVTAIMTLWLLIDRVNAQ